MVGDRERLHHTLTRVLASDCGEDALKTAVAALRTVVGCDLQRFLASLPPPQHASIALFDALALQLDVETAPQVARHPGLAASVARGLDSPNPERRGAALALMGKLLLVAPLALAPAFVPVLTTAALHEGSAVQALALAALSDAVYLLARSPASEAAPVSGSGGASADADGPAPVASALASTLALLQAMLYAPSAELQRIAALGLAKVALDPRCSEPTSLVAQVHDIEAIQAELAFRYTAEATSGGTGGGGGKGAEVDAMPTMAVLWEALSSERPISLSNTVIWLCLGAAEERVARGESWPLAATGGAGWTLDGHTLRCVRFLLDLLPVRATSEAVVRAVRLNLQAEHGISLSEASIAQWIGIGA